MPLPNISGIAKVFAGAEYSMLLKTDGTVLVMGKNSSGQLGLDSGAPSAVYEPTLNAMLSGITDIALYESHSMFIKKED